MSKPPIRLRSCLPEDRDFIRRVGSCLWGSSVIVTRGRKHDLLDLPALLAQGPGGPLGFISYREDSGVEVVALSSIRQGQGVGSALLESLAQRSRELGHSRLWLITTKDNTPALRFYQRRGFFLKALHRGAVEEARLIKPEIPRLGVDDIPIRDELELERFL